MPSQETPHHQAPDHQATYLPRTEKPAEAPPAMIRQGRLRDHLAHAGLFCAVAATLAWWAVLAASAWSLIG